MTSYRTTERMAEIIGSPRSKIRKARFILAHSGSADVGDRIRAGNISIDAGFEEARERHRLERGRPPRRFTLQA